MNHMMFFAFLLSFLISSQLLAHEKSKQIPFSFNSPQLTKMNNDAGETAINIEGLMNTFEAGLPSVPVKTYKIAIPKGMELGNVTLNEGQRTLVLGKIKRNLSQMPVSWAQYFNKEDLTPTPAPDYFGNQYPTDRISIHLQKLHTVSVAIINFYPVVEVRDVASNREFIDFIRDGSLDISFRESYEEDRTLLFSHQMNELQQFVENPEDLSGYHVRKHAPKEAYDYLIITTKAIAAFGGDNNLKTLQANLLKRGFKSKIALTETINREVQNIVGEETEDLQGKIRNFIKNEYKNYGIKYVLLAADGDASSNNDDDGKASGIPARLLWSKIRAYFGYWTTITERIPADIYYSCLDGVYNGNGNSDWGEINDGDNGKDVDVVPEVVIGRLSIDTEEDLNNIVKKTIWASDYKFDKKIFMVGEKIFAEINCWGGRYMNQLIGHCTDHNYVTDGYTSDWAIDKLYDMDHEWDSSELLSAIKEKNYSMLNHLGHSNTNYNMKLYSVDGFENTIPFFHYTQGCLPGRFIVNDSFIEELVRLPVGAFASVANTSYGLAPEDPAPETTTTPGGSQMLHRQFINAVFTEHITRLGNAHLNSKMDFVGFTNTQEMRFAYWTSNFFGDPSLEMKFK